MALLLPAAASAATTPPTLSAPAGGASPTEGGSIKFAWEGALQGDPTQLARSYFRLELAKAEDVSGPAQAVWSKLERSQQTDPGAATQSITTGVPEPGAYKWRVCAWGVADMAVANEIAQLPGGCSQTRAFTAVAAASQQKTVGVVNEERKVTVSKQEQVITRQRPVEAAPEPETIYVPAPTPPEPESTVSKVVKPKANKDGGFTSATSLSDDSDSGFDAERASARRAGLGGAVATGLGASLPGIPIPFWTLALLAAAIPLVRRWRRNVLGMFDWPEDGQDDEYLHNDSDATFIKPLPVGTDRPAAPESRGSRAA